MIASDQMYLLRIDNFESKKQANSFERMASSINKIP